MVQLLTILLLGSLTPPIQEYKRQTDVDEGRLHTLGVCVCACVCACVWKIKSLPLFYLFLFLLRNVNFIHGIK